MHQIFAGDRPKRTRFTLLHSSPSVSDLPPGKILDGLRERSMGEPNLFRMQIYVDVLDKKMEGLHVGRIDGNVIEKLFQNSASKRSLWKSWWRRRNDEQEDKTCIEETKRVLFLICGPQP